MAHRNRSRHARCGKVGDLLLVFGFAMRVWPSCGNVEISRCGRDFQGAVETVGSLPFRFPPFSTGPSFPQLTSLLRLSEAPVTVASGPAALAWPSASVGLPPYRSSAWTEPPATRL